MQKDRAPSFVRPAVRPQPLVKGETIRQMPSHRRVMFTSVFSLFWPLP
jgi:hypothetical protein